MGNRKPVYVEFFNENGHRIYYICCVIVPENFKLVCCRRGDWSSIHTIKFQSCNFTEFPPAEYLLDFLPHLNKLTISNCGLTKISCEDLRGLKNLKGLNLLCNDITKLPKGLFDCTPKLEWITFAKNKIEEIDADILKPLRDLSHFDLRHNKSIDVLYDQGRSTSEMTLEQFKEAIKRCDPIELIKQEMKKEVEKLTSDREVIFEEKYKKLAQENTNLKRQLSEHLKVFNELRAEIKQLKGIFECDFTVVINGKEFKVNKEILIANSPVLAKLISDNPDAENLELFDISEEAFKNILKFMQTKKPPSENANYVELFAAASRLEMTSLVDVSAGVLMKKITPENAPDIMRICKKFGYKELCEEALKVFAKSL